MARVSRGVQAHAKHKKVLKKAKGYYGARSKVYRVANRRLLRLDSTLIVIVVNVVDSSADYGLCVSMQRRVTMA